MTGGVWAATVRAEVGAQLAARGAHYGTCRTARDGTRTVSWWFSCGARRRERRLVFRALGGALDDWEVEYTELAAAEHGRADLVHASRVVHTHRDGLGEAVTDLLGTRPVRRGRARVVPDDGCLARVAGSRPVVPDDGGGSPDIDRAGVEGTRGGGLRVGGTGVGGTGVGGTGAGGMHVPAGIDGAAPGPRAAQAAASARRPPPPPRGIRVADGLLGMVVAVALLLSCRLDTDLAPSIASFAVPLLGVSAAWALIGLAGVERRR